MIQEHYRVVVRRARESGTIGQDWEDTTTLLSVLIDSTADLEKERGSSRFSDRRPSGMPAAHRD